MLLGAELPAISVGSVRARRASADGNSENRPLMHMVHTPRSKPRPARVRVNSNSPAFWNLLTLANAKYMLPPQHSMITAGYNWIRSCSRNPALRVGCAGLYLYSLPVSVTTPNPLLDEPRPLDFLPVLPAGLFEMHLLSTSSYERPCPISIDPFSARLTIWYVLPWVRT